MSTLEAINGSIQELVPHLGLELIAEEQEWFLRDSTGFKVLFRDGVSVPTKAENPLELVARRVRMHTDE